jgi:hypothetical protein
MARARKAKTDDATPSKVPSSIVSNTLVGPWESTSQKGGDYSLPPAHATESINFQVKTLHKKALSVLLACHYNGNRSLTYAELSMEMGIGEKTKAWQCEAWKDLKTNDVIVPATKNSQGKQTFQLSEAGLQLAKGHSTDAEMEDFKPAGTNQEHHQKIKARLVKHHPKGKKYGPKIFDFLVTTVGDGHLMTKDELAAQLGTVADSHGFFYGFKGRSNLSRVCVFSLIGSIEYLRDAK